MLKSSSEFSVIVTFEQNVAQFEDSLASVLRYLPDNTQVIAVHDGSYSDPHELAEVDFVTSERGTQLGGQLGAALRIAEAPLIGLIRAGVQLDEGWHTAVLDSFEDPEVASVSPAIVNEARPRKLVSAGVDKAKAFKRKLNGVGVRLGRKASRLNPLGPSSWAAFYRRSVLDLLGTPDCQLESSYLDLDLALGIQQLGFKAAFQQECVVLVDDDTEILKEANQAHGTAAARAKTRFGDRSSSVVESIAELITAPLWPWHVKHVLGKLSARPMQDIDQAYWRRLTLKIDELKLDSDDRESVLQIPGRDEGFRRAA